MPRILLAVDETDQSVHAARVAQQLFGADAQYLAVNVSEQPVDWVTPGVVWGGVYAWAPYPWPGASPEEGGERWNELEQSAEQVAAGLARDAGVDDARAVGEVGDPVVAILEAAEQHEADVIVVGSHSKGWWQRLIEGSVSESLVREAHRPVLVVKEPERATE